MKTKEIKVSFGTSGRLDSRNHSKKTGTLNMIKKKLIRKKHLIISNNKECQRNRTYKHFILTH